MSQQLVMVAAWEPDMPDLATATSIAINVLPATPQSYGPFPSFTPWTPNALDSQCVGAISVQAADQSVYLFAGSTDKLYEITGSSPSWVDVSGSTYAVTPGDNWRFALYSNAVIATDFTDPLQSFTLGVSTAFGPLFTAPAWAQSTAYPTVGEMVLANGNRYILTTPGTSDASGTGPSGIGDGITDGSCIWNYQSSPPPLARFVCTPKNFLMVGNTSDPIGGLSAQRAWWSASGDPTTWPQPGTAAAIQVQSDFNDFEGNFGSITGLVDSLANADVAIFFRHAVWRGVYAGPPDVFDFFPTENVRGCPAPNSIIPLGALVSYLGEDGFYTFDGATSVPIGANKFDQWFWKNVNQSYLWMVIGAANVPAKTLMWAFPSTASGQGLCDTILAYRWDIQRASYIYLGPGHAIEWMLRALTFGSTMEGLVTLGYTDLDTLPASLDSPEWVGGSLLFSGVNAAHKLGFFNGPNMAASVATQTVQLTPGRRSFFQSARPLVDLVDGTPTIAISGRVNLYDAENFGDAIPPNAAGECPQRNDARYHDALIQIPAEAVWTHIEGIDATFTSAGLR